MRGFTRRYPGWTIRPVRRPSNTATLVRENVSSSLFLALCLDLTTCFSFSHFQAVLGPGGGGEHCHDGGRLRLQARLPAVRLLGQGLLIKHWQTHWKLNISENNENWTCTFTALRDGFAKPAHFIIKIVPIMQHLGGNYFELPYLS